MLFAAIFMVIFVIYDSKYISIQSYKLIGGIAFSESQSKEFWVRESRMAESRKKNTREKSPRKTVLWKKIPWTKSPRKIFDLILSQFFD